MKCPVGYAVHFPDFDLDSSQITAIFRPFAPGNKGPVALEHLWIKA
jgi:hypothetical protein